ncbi:MAG: hypothetical protein V8R91_16315 [Butyricimonas faecihominis]
MSYSASWLPETPTQSGGQLVRHYNMNALRNSVKPYQSANGKWVIPTSYEEVYNYTQRFNDFPCYNYFFGNPARTKCLRSSRQFERVLQQFHGLVEISYRTANVYNANLQASGGSENMRYMIGAGYYKEEGIMIGSDFERVNVISNVSAQSFEKSSTEQPDISNLQ